MPKKKRFKCLRCGKSFASDGKHNRICRPCTLANAGCISIGGLRIDDGRRALKVKE